MAVWLSEDEYADVLNDMHANYRAPAAFSAGWDGGFDPWALDEQVAPTAGGPGLFSPAPAPAFDPWALDEQVAPTAGGPGLYAPPAFDAGPSIDFASTFDPWTYEERLQPAPEPIDPWMMEETVSSRGPGAFQWSDSQYTPGVDEPWWSDPSMPAPGSEVPTSFADIMGGPRGGPSEAERYYGLAGDFSPERQYGDLYPEYSGMDLAGDIFGNAVSGERFWGNVLGGQGKPIDPFAWLPDREIMGVSLEDVADSLTAPVNLVTLGLGGPFSEGGAAMSIGEQLGAGALNFTRNVAADVAGRAAGEGTQAGLQAYSESDLPFADVAGNPWVQGIGATVGGLLAGGAVYGGLENADDIARAARRYGEDLAAAPEVLGRAPTAAERMVAGSAIDPDTGLPLDYAPVLGASEDIPEVLGKVPTALPRGEQVLDPVTGKVLEVARKFSGTEHGTVTLKDPETGEIVRRKRFLLKDAPEAAGEAPGTGIAPEPGVSPIRVAASADGASIVEPPPDLRLPRTAGGDLVPPTAPPLRPTGDMSFREAIINHLKGEWYYRISGQAKQELREGRLRQVRGIVEGVSSATGTEAMKRARAGARGRILSTREPLVLSPSQLDEANTAIVEAIRAGTIMPFEFLQVDDALEAMRRGERAQPKQIRLVRTVFGDDMADLAIAATPPRTEYQFFRGAEREAEATVRNYERALQKAADLRKKAEIAAREAEGQLLAASDPGLASKRLKGAMDATAGALLGSRDEFDTKMAKAVKAFNDADAAEIRATREYIAKQQERWLKEQQQLATRENRVQVQRQERFEAAQKQVFDEDDAREIAASRQYEADVAARNERTAQRDVAKENRAEVRANERRDRLNPNDEQVLKKARERITGSEGLSAGMKIELQRVVESWLGANRVLLDTIGEAGESTLKEMGRNLRAAVTGEVADSYVTRLATQRELLRGALEASGADPDLAQKVTKVLVEMELRKRYKGPAPERITGLVKQTKDPFRTKGALDDIGRGARALNQQIKNTMFGPLDFGVPGLQGLKVLTTDSVQITAGLVNRLAGLLHLPHVDTMDGSVLARRAQYTLDGVVHSVSGGATDVTQEGTLLGLLGKPGRALDWIPRHIIDANNRLQFGLMLGTLRDIAYEGNLVLAKAVGADINDPAVRRAAAIRANAATSAAHGAASGRRRLAESAMLLTPSMSRAQVEQVGQVVQGLLRPANRAEFMLSAATIASAGIGLLTIGKVINDLVGMDEFEFDPSKPGFGRVTVNGYSVDLFPQEQILKYTAQAVRALAEGDPGEARDAMLKLGIGRSSPVLQAVEKGASFGFDPQQVRYGLGDFGIGMSWQERVLSMSPLPPLLSDLLIGSKDTTERVASAFGVNANKESAARTYDRQLPKPWAEMDGMEKRAAEAQFGPRPMSEVPQYREKQESAEAIRQRRTDDEAKAAAQFAKDGDGQAFRQALSDAAERQAGEYRQLYEGKPFAPTNVEDQAVRAYFEAMDASRDGYGRVDSEAFQQRVAELEKQWGEARGKDGIDRAAYVEAFLGLRKEHSDPVMQQYYDDLATIRDSGYWDVESQKADWREQHPEIDQLLRKYGFGGTTTKAMDTVTALRTEQQASDRAFESGEVSIDQWRKDLDRRENERAGAYRALYADIPANERTEKDKALASYYGFIQMVTDAQGNVDWDSVDGWLEAQPANVQAAVASRPDTSLTPLVSEFKADRKAIGESGYWDLADEVAAAFAQQKGLPQYASAGEMQQDVWRQYYQQAQDSGYDEVQARAVANVYADRFLQPYTSYMTKLRDWWRSQPENWETVQKLIRWGYWEPGAADTAAIAGAGR